MQSDEIRRDLWCGDRVWSLKLIVIFDMVYLCDFPNFIYTSQREGACSSTMTFIQVYALMVRFLTKDITMLRHLSMSVWLGLALTIIVLLVFQLLLYTLPRLL